MARSAPAAVVPRIPGKIGSAASALSIRRRLGPSEAEDNMVVFFEDGMIGAFRNGRPFRPPASSQNWGHARLFGRVTPEIPEAENKYGSSGRVHHDLRNRPFDRHVPWHVNSNGGSTLEKRPARGHS